MVPKITALFKTTMSSGGSGSVTSPLLCLKPNHRLTDTIGANITIPTKNMIILVDRILV